MKNKLLFIPDKVGGDWFRFIYSRKGKSTIEDFLIFNPNDYYIYKITKRQREITYQEFLDFNYSGYIFFKKSRYSNIEINRWLDFLYTFVFIPYLSKPLPPIEYIQKIKIKK